MARQNLDELFVATLGELHDAEAQLAVGLPVLGRANLDAGLERLVADMHRATCGQMMRYETVFEMLGKRAEGEPCWSVAPLVVDAYDAAASRCPFSRHSGIGLALLSILHLQIVRLQSLIAWSRRCSMDHLAELLQVPLVEKVVFARRMGVHALAADQLALRETREPVGRTLN